MQHRGRRRDPTRAARLLPVPGGYLVAGTAGGARLEPQWFRNLRAVEPAIIQRGAEKIDVGVRIAAGSEREALWRDVVLALALRRQRYAERAGRPIPIAVLVPSRTTGMHRGEAAAA